PQPKGRWRWIGTKTLLFEPADRFPMATEYQVSIHAGTKSETGGTLAAEEKFAFRTPPLTAKTEWPSGDSPQRLDPVIFIEFDQKIDAAAVLKSIHVKGAGHEVEIRAATKAEIEKDEQVRVLASAAD